MLFQSQGPNMEFSNDDDNNNNNNQFITSEPPIGNYIKQGFDTHIILLLQVIG